MINQRFLLAALGDDDFNAVSGMGGEGLFQKLALFNLMRQHDLRRDGLVVIKLADKARQNLGIRIGFISARKIGARAPVLARADEKRLDAELSALVGQPKHISLFNVLRVDALCLRDKTHRLNPVAQQRCSFKLHRLRSRLHALGHFSFHGNAFAGEKIFGVAHQHIIGRPVDEPHARG